jgi:hydrogenase maturation protease
MKTIVVGLGNPILGDDGVGWHVAEAVQAQFHGAGEGQQVDIVQLSLGGLSLMESLVGYQRAIIIDALNLGMGETGSVYCFALQELPNPNSGHLGSAHDTSLMTALEVGRKMGAELPDEVIVVGIESPYVYDFSEQLSPAVSSAIPQATRAVLSLLQAGDCPQTDQTG